MIDMFYKPSVNNHDFTPIFEAISTVHDEALKRLARAIIIQAAIDAGIKDKTGLESREWLLSWDCTEMCEFIGLDFRAVRKWVINGCQNWRKHKR